VRIGYLATKFPPIPGGGETHMATIAREMSKLGHDVEVITGAHPDRDQDNFPYEIHEVEGLNDKDIKFSAVADVSIHLKNADYDMLHVVNYEGLLYHQFARPVGRLAAKHTVFSIYNTPISGKRVFDGIGKDYSLEKQAVQDSLRLGLVDKFIANSHAFVNGLQDVGVENTSIALIPFGIDTNLFTPPAEKRDNGTIDVVCTSRFIGRKGIEFLLASMDYLPDEYRLHLTGSGTVHIQEAHQQLTEQAQRHGLRVSIAADRTNLRELVKLYQEADVFAMPSEFEGFGLSALEAMACNTPVVATDVQGLQEFVRHGVTGLLVEYGNPRQLASAIRRVTEDETLRKTMTENALTMAREDYTFDGMIRNYAEFYIQVGSSK
jgi:glycosyltransferase involved in cell wall biosynthesis